MKKILLALVVLAAAGCGWEPMYVEQKNQSLWYFGGEFDTSITNEITQVKVEKISTRFGQQVRNHLLDSLTPRGVPREPKYRLYVEPQDKTVILQALQDDITATRERVKYMVTYRMMEGDENVMEGNSIAYVSYDVLKNPYSTTIAQKKASMDAAKIISDDIALRVGTYFHTRLMGSGDGSF